MIYKLYIYIYSPYSHRLSFVSEQAAMPPVRVTLRDISAGNSYHASPTESQMAQPILMSCDLPRGERFRAFKYEFAERSFSMKEVIVPGPAPQPGAQGSQPTCTAASRWHQHAPQGPAHITTPLFRAHPPLGKLGSEVKAHTPQLDSGSSF